MRTTWTLIFSFFFPPQSIASVFRAFRLFAERTKLEICDFRFNLLRAYAEPASSAAALILRPESYGSNPLNYRLAYLARAVLRHLSQRDPAQLRRIVLPLASDPAAGLRLSLRFAEQLEAVGLWHWAA